MVPLSEPYAALLSSSEDSRSSEWTVTVTRVIAGVTTSIRLVGTLCEDPAVSLVADFGHKRKIVSAEAAGIFPVVSFHVES